MQLIEDLLTFWKLITKEQPIWMFVKFMPAFIVLIKRRKKGSRVRYMDDDWPFMLATDGPNRIEPGIIDGDQLARFVPITQSQPLIDL